MSTASQQRKPSKTTRTEWVERWCPPQPLVGLQPIERVLNRHTEVSCPESRLVVAVIARAIHDCLSLSNRRQRRAARRFILGPHLEGWCDLVGMHPHFVRLVAHKAGYLVDEKTHWQKVLIKVTARTDPVITEVNGSSTPIHTTTAKRTGGTVHA